MCAQMIAGNNRKEIDDDEKLESGRVRLFFLFFFLSSRYCKYLEASSPFRSF